MHIGLFYFNAFFLYTRFFNSRSWWIYVASLTAIVLLFFNIKLYILNAWFPLLAKDVNVIPFTLFPILLFLVISTVYRLVSDKIKGEKERLDIQLKFLRSQVNPHFLFNVLNSLVSMARLKSDQLEPSLLKLSELMRYMLHESDEKTIPLNRECDYLRSYIQLQELRYENDIEIQSKISCNNATNVIEPMLLIPFVENAFKHGITSSQKPVISIDMQVEESSLRLRVKNRYEGAAVKDNGSGIGLANVKVRLRLLYPKRHKLDIRNDGSRFEVELTIDLST